MTRTKSTAPPSMIAVFLILVSVFLSSPASAQTVDAHHRPFTIDDLFEIEGLGRYYGGPFSFSPDGNALAFVRVRAQRLTKDFSMDFLWGAERSDVWIQKRPQDPPIKLTNGEEDGTGWWVPQWSADGRYLAMLSTRGGNVTLWVEDLNTNQLHQLTQRSIDLGDIRRVPYMWIDSRHILTEVLPVGEQPESMKIDTETPEIATEGWKKQRAGKEVTASVLDSGVPINLAARPHGQLQRVDVTSGAVETVADENISARSPSPDGKFVAYARQVSVYTPKADEPLPFGINDEKKYSLIIKSVAGTTVANGDQYSRDVLTSSLRWSPDSKQLAFLGYSDTREKAPRLYKIAVMDREVKEQDLGDLDPTPVIRHSPELEWTSEGGICLLAAKRVGGKKPGAEDRRDWWLIGRDGSERNLTEQATQVPPKLWPAEGRNTFVGLADGKLWRVTPATTQIVNATESVSVKIAAITWPLEDDPMGESQSSLSDREFNEIVFATGEGRNLSLSLLNLNSGAIRPLQKPVASASLNAFDSVSGSMVFSSSDHSGTFVWRTSLREGAPVQLVKANTFLTDIVDGKPQMIEYVSLDGEKLKAWILLPYNYQPGHRYPTVTWVYAGSVAKDSPSVLDDITFFSPLNLQIFSSRGYAVLIPSMPLKPEGEVDDPMLRLLNGVIPAVDKGIDAGIIDPDRLFVMGQSFGGFSTYGLITQTNRFKAAVSLAGLSDLISLYGQFDARQRYGAYPHEDLFMEALTEGGQVLMGSPPWKDLGRYIRNSPIFFVDRVQTPILIIQGDLDYVAMQQGEEFFKSLYRQGKRARFVRYWGEDHVFTSPANIRDMWQQIFAWFDGFGGPTKGPSGTTGTGH